MKPSVLSSFARSIESKTIKTYLSCDRKRYRLNDKLWDTTIVVVGQKNLLSVNYRSSAYII